MTTTDVTNVGSIGIYIIGAELPDWGHAFKDNTGAIIDMSSGWTFEVKIASAPGQTALLTKTTNISGASGSSGYNVLVSWATTSELSTLSTGTYTVQLRANRTSDSRDRIVQGTVTVGAVIS